jgi:UDP-glucose 4-epimerase
MNILVVGGAGYIGSHMVKLLLEKGHEVSILDNFSTGYRKAIVGGALIEGDLSDCKLLSNTFENNSFGCVMHFASRIQVGESVRDPALYYRSNYVHTLNLLDAMRNHRVNHLIFSSTAAIFGEPEYIPIDEAHPQRPINPYGLSKYMVEKTLADFDSAYGLKSICLRYFNAAGADPEGRLGECHEPETHLIPLLLQVASGRRPSMDIYGNDYDTPDGTCIRDYIHVADICQAHLLAMNNLLATHRSKSFNLGNGTGFSVKEIIAAVEKVTKKSLTLNRAPRRPGDPEKLIADSSAAKEELGWQPKYKDPDSIIQHAWAWEKKIHSGLAYS